MPTEERRTVAFACRHRNANGQGPVNRDFGTVRFLRWMGPPYIFGVEDRFFTRRAAASVSRLFSSEGLDEQP